MKQLHRRIINESSITFKRFKKIHITFSEESVIGNEVTDLSCLLYRQLPKSIATISEENVQHHIANGA